MSEKYQQERLLLDPTVSRRLAAEARANAGPNPSPEQLSKQYLPRVLEILREDTNRAKLEALAAIQAWFTTFPNLDRRRTANSVAEIFATCFPAERLVELVHRDAPEPHSQTTAEREISFEQDRLLTGFLHLLFYLDRNTAFEIANRVYLKLEGNGLLCDMVKHIIEENGNG